MIGKEIKSGKEVPMYVVKDALKERNSEGELNYEQTAAYDYVKKFSALPKSKGKKLEEELAKAVQDNALRVKIVDILPATVDKLRLLIPKGMKTEDAQLQEIVKIVNKHAPKSK